MHRIENTNDNFSTSFSFHQFIKSHEHLPQYWFRCVHNRLILCARGSTGVEWDGKIKPTKIGTKKIIINKWEIRNVTMQRIIIITNSELGQLTTTHWDTAPTANADTNKRKKRYRRFNKRTKNRNRWMLKTIFSILIIIFISGFRFQFRTKFK